MATMNEQTVHNFLEARGNLWPPTATEIAEETGIALSTVYVALKSIHAERTKRGKNQFGYVLPDPVEVEFPSVEQSLGIVNGRSWRHIAETTMKVVAEATLTDNISAGEYAEGFESLGYRFLELAAHAAALQDRPDWKIVLGFSPDTTKE